MPSRREQIRMTPDELRHYIATELRLIIVSNGRDGYPHPMPMNFWVDEDNRFYVTTFRKSQKVKNFQRDPKAALLIESGIAYHDLKSVLVYAMAEILDDEKIILETMERMAQKGNGATTVNVRDQVAGTIPKRVVIRFTPERFISWDHSKLGNKY